MKRINKIFCIFLLGSGCAAPSYDVEIIAQNEQECQEAETNLMDAIELWSLVRVDLQYTGCRINTDYSRIIVADDRLDTSEKLDEWDSYFPVSDDVMRFYIVDRIDSVYPGKGFFKDDAAGFMFRSKCRNVGAINLFNPKSKITFAHEIGHFATLGHSNDKTNLMAPGSESEFNLTSHQIEKAQNAIWERNVVCLE